MVINLKCISRGKNIEIPVRKMGFFGKIKGLMFKSSRENLLFDFSSDTRIKIHSFFVFFPFLVVWLDKKNKVLEWKIVKPFTVAVSPKKPYRKLVEVPLNKKNTKIIEFFVGKERFK
jgi:uncharacterized membrane protein (UPF0127 family)